MSAFVRETQIVTCDRKGEQKKVVELNIQTEGRKLYYGSHRGRAHISLTSPKQAKLNDRRAWEYLEMLIEMNFGAGDYHVSLTYDKKYLPSTLEVAKCDYDRFLARAKKLYRAHGIKLDALMVMSQSTKRGELTRLHMHVIMRGGVPREEIEVLWRGADRGGRSKSGEESKRFGERLGYADCDRLQVGGNGLAPLCAYLKKQPRDGIARRWFATVGLKKPYISGRNDDKYDIADVKSIAERNADAVDVAWWERQYPGWTVYDAREYAYRCTDSEFSGVSIRIKLRRLTEEELQERKREREGRKCRKESADERD